MIERRARNQEISKKKEVLEGEIGKYRKGGRKDETSD